ncbi:hypothetical protein AJ87_11955 [Rhizobium yanglingense]|nr:hypothetical protein AJ87_11955 [Rhizobium yanglingense]
MPKDVDAVEKDILMAFQSLTGHWISDDGFPDDLSFAKRSRITAILPSASRISVRCWFAEGHTHRTAMKQFRQLDPSPADLLQ